MSQSDGAAGLDLLTEEGYDRATGVEDISEAHDRIFRRDGTDRVSLYDLLCGALGRPHDVSRPHCLVGANLDEIAHPTPIRRFH